MKNSIRHKMRRGALGLAFLGMACTPEVRIRAPEEPIVINLNIKIQQEIRIKVERDIDNLLLNNKDLF